MREKLLIKVLEDTLLKKDVNAKHNLMLLAFDYFNKKYDEDTASEYLIKYSESIERWIKEGITEVGYQHGYAQQSAKYVCSSEWFEEVSLSEVNIEVGMPRVKDENVLGAIMNLKTPMQRTVAFLHFVDTMPFSDIAKICGITPTRVYQIVNKCKRRLQYELASYRFTDMEFRESAETISKIRGELEIEKLAKESAKKKRLIQYRRLLNKLSLIESEINEIINSTGYADLANLHSLSKSKVELENKIAGSYPDVQTDPDLIAIGKDFTKDKVLHDKQRAELKKRISVSSPEISELNEEIARLTQSIMVYQNETIPSLAGFNTPSYMVCLNIYGSILEERNNLVRKRKKLAEELKEEVVNEIMGYCTTK